MIDTSSQKKKSQPNWTPPTQTFDYIRFGVLTDHSTQKRSKVTLMDADLTPGREGGLFDPHLGSLSNNKQCLTCGNTRECCQGHTGCLQLKDKFAYIQPMFMQIIKLILSKQCPKCHKHIVGSQCCGIAAPTIKDTKNMCLQVTYDGKKLPVWYPQKIKQELNFVDLQTAYQRYGISVLPSDLVQSVLLISSPIIRPDKKVAAQFKQQDNSSKMLQEIAKRIFYLNKPEETRQDIVNMYTDMRVHITNYIKEEADQKGGAHKSISGLLTQKKGLIRQDLLGKQVEKMGRAVITCDPSNLPDVISISQFFATQIFMKETCHEFNRDRLQICFDNGPTIYPGSKFLIKSDGKRYQIGNLNVKLELGDTIFRHMQTGDFALFNRQPSLLPASITSHQVKVQDDPKLCVMAFNDMACPLYNADFDGDEMSILNINNWTSLVEAEFISSTHQRILNMKTGNILITIKEDGIIGNFLISKEKYKFDTIFALRMLQNTKTNANFYKYNSSEFYSGKQIISMILPEVSYRHPTTFYRSEMSNFIKYTEQDRMLSIKLGKIESGYVDSSINNYLKQIVQTTDPKTALNLIFSLQQIGLMFNQHNSMSVGMHDFYVSAEHREMILQKKLGLMRNCSKTIIAYSQNELNTKDINCSRYDHMINTLMTQMFDECLVEILTLIKIEGNDVQNKLFDMLLCGSKGKLTNTKSMLIYIGFALLHNQALKHQFQHRINVFFKRNDYDPRSYGIIMNSYANGLTPSEMMFNSPSERENMLKKVLTVSKAGALGRKFIKNFEMLMILNNRFVGKRFKLMQPLFGYDGFQVISISYYQIPNLFDSTETLTQKLLKDLAEDLKVNEIVLQHIKLIIKYLHEFKISMVHFQNINDAYSFTDKIVIPIVIKTLLETKLQQLSDQVFDAQNLLKNITILQDFIKNLQYIYFNSMMKDNQAFVPRMYDRALTNLKIALLTTFDTKSLGLFQNNQLVDMLSQIEIMIMYKLEQYGTPIGIHLAQCFQQNLTQEQLNSIHKTGGGVVQQGAQERLQDILSSKHVQKQRACPIIKVPMFPTTTLERAELITNQVKSTTLNQVVDKWQLIFSRKEDVNDLNYEFLSDNFQTITLPQDITCWCLRVQINNRKMYTNKLVINQIIERLESIYSAYVVVIKVESVEYQVLRIYINQCMQFDDKQSLKNVVDTLLETIIKGVSNIDTVVLGIKKYFKLQEDGALIENQRYYLNVYSRDLLDVYQLQSKYANDIDFDNITCNNIYLTYKWFGKTAAIQKIVNEIQGAIKDDVDTRFLYLMADEMLSIGNLTNLENRGIRERNPSNTLLQLSESGPMPILKNAALQGKRSYVQSLSDSMILGQIPEFGTNYNKICLDESLMIKLQTVSEQQDHTDSLMDLE